MQGIFLVSLLIINDPLLGTATTNTGGCVWQVCDVVERVMANPDAAQLVKDLNPEFVAPKRPFKRMSYKDAIKYLEEHDIRKEDGSIYTFGEVCTL